MIAMTLVSHDKQKFSITDRKQSEIPVGWECIFNQFYLFIHLILKNHEVPTCVKLLISHYQPVNWTNEKREFWNDVELFILLDVTTFRLL